jgi:predicted nucleic acid-binding protein
VILVDTSVWVDHLRSGDERLLELLRSREVATHAFIIGEIAMGSMRDRMRVLGQMQELPKVLVAGDDEVLALVSRWGLFGRGISYVDAHLLASARLMPGTNLWSRDRRLHAAAAGLSLDAGLS